MRVLVTGSKGQLVSALLKLRAPGFTFFSAGRPGLDLAEPESIARAIAEARPDAVVNAAAYTAVDQAEAEPELAERINGAGAGAVAEAAAKLGAPLIQLSTDYVFDGTALAPHVETHPVNPRTVYGRSKLAGERAALAAHPGAVVLRTAWVYSPSGQNFPRTMLKLAASRDEVSVVDDQHGNPTAAADLAEAIAAILKNIGAAPDDQKLRGIFHCTGTGEASWSDFAEEIFAVSRARGGPAARVKRISTADFAASRPGMAARPKNSRLDCGKLAHVHGISLPDWRKSVQGCVEKVLAGEQRT